MIGGAPIAAGTNGDSRPAPSASATRISVSGKADAQQDKPGDGQQPRLGAKRGGIGT